MADQKPANIDAYISMFPESVQQVLQDIRNVIQNEAPDATEKISYGMPAFVLQKKPLIYFAAYEKHIGLYALPTSNEVFKKEFSKYKTGKGSVQFPLDKPMPFALITKVVKCRVKEVQEQLSNKEW